MPTSFPSASCLYLPVDTMSSGRDHKNPIVDLSDPVVTRLAEQDKTPWFQKPNLRILYVVLLPTCIGVEMTSGYV